MVGDFESQQRFQRIYDRLADWGGEDETLDFHGDTLDTLETGILVAAQPTAGPNADALARRQRFLASLLLQLLYGHKEPLVHAHLWHLGAARTLHSITWTGGPLVDRLLQASEFGYWPGHKHTVRELEFILWCGGHQPFTGRLCDVPDRIRFAGSMLTWQQLGNSTPAQLTTLATLIHDSFKASSVRGLEDTVYQRAARPGTGVQRQASIKHTLESFRIVANDTTLQAQENKALYLCDNLTFYGHVNTGWGPNIFYGTDPNALTEPEEETLYFRMRDHEPGMTIDDLVDKYAEQWIPYHQDDFEGFLNAVAPVEREPLKLTRTIFGKTEQEIHTAEERVLRRIAGKLGLKVADKEQLVPRIIEARTADGGGLKLEIPGYKWK